MTALAPTRASALASPLTAFPGWSLLAHCERCRVTCQLPIADLAKHVDPAATIADVPPRLRCNRCREPPRNVKLADGQGPSARAVWVIGDGR